MNYYHNEVCSGCEYLTAEEMPKGMTAFRCMREGKHKGRTLDVISEGGIGVINIYRPAWCFRCAGNIEKR